MHETNGGFVALKRYHHENIVQAFALDAYLYMYVHLMLIRLFRLLLSWEIPRPKYRKTTIFSARRRKKKTIPLLKAGKLYGRHRMLSSSSSLYFYFAILLLLFLLVVSNENSSTNMFLSSLSWAGQNAPLKTLQWNACLCTCVLCAVCTLSSTNI